MKTQKEKTMMKYLVTIMLFVYVACASAQTYIKPMDKQWIAYLPTNPSAMAIINRVSYLDKQIAAKSKEFVYTSRLMEANSKATNKRDEVNSNKIDKLRKESNLLYSEKQKQIGALMVIKVRWQKDNGYL